MKLNIQSCLVVAFLATVLLIPIAVYTYHLPSTETSKSAISETNSLAPHERIVIQDLGDFTIPGTGSGCECVRRGSGSSSDPFLISDWKLSVPDDNGISIQRTTVHFIILNVIVNTTEVYNSAVLRNVTNGTIQDSYFFGGGISLFNSDEISIINNTITSTRFGILLEASNNNSISDNRLDRIDQVGIFVRASGNLIERNRLTNGYFGGINIDGTTNFGDDNRIENNLVEGNAQYGVGLWQARNNLIKGNVISSNGGAGIILTSSSTKNQVEHNNVVNNSGDGIIVDEQSAENKITSNTVTGNGDGATSFDLHDEGLDNLWLSNTFNTKRPDTIG
jgi:parallel beta-helix repeat protein